MTLQKKRTCGKCKEEKDIDQFRFIKATGYYQSYCKECMNEYNKLNAKERRQKQKAEEKSPERVFANILARKRLTEDDNSV